MQTMAHRHPRHYWLPLFLVIPLSIALASIPSTALASTDKAAVDNAVVDNAIYGDLLKRYVRNGHVDYRGLKAEEQRLDDYLAVLAAVDPDALARDERFAFYINAYNAWTLKLILSGYPGVDSIKDLGGFLSTPWKKKLAKIDGQTLTLDQIEHDILRPTFKDARVHFAINCAAVSCPPLMSEPFEGDRLDAQLEAATTAFINRTDRTYLKGDTLYVSRIFKWFNEDFSPDVATFVGQFAEGDLKAGMAAVEDLQVSYLDYDWSLNGE